MKAHESPACVVIFARPGRIKLEALYVNVKTQSNMSSKSVPAVTVPNELIAFVPVT
jgi:hypothetical protein